MGEKEIKEKIESLLEEFQGDGCIVDNELELEEASAVVAYIFEEIKKIYDIPMECFYVGKYESSGYDVKFYNFVFYLNNKLHHVTAKFERY